MDAKKALLRRTGPRSAYELYLMDAVNEARLADDKAGVVRLEREILVSLSEAWKDMTVEQKLPYTRREEDEVAWYSDNPSSRPTTAEQDLAWQRQLSDQSATTAPEPEPTVSADVETEEKT